jgi:ABC-type branched-subunit amino acid transport system ATPase component
VPALSGGEQQMLAIDDRRMSRPRLLPSTSLAQSPAPGARDFRTIVEINRSGTTALLVDRTRTWRSIAGRSARDRPRSSISRGRCSRTRTKKAYLGAERQVRLRVTDLDRSP